MRTGPALPAVALICLMTSTSAVPALAADGVTLDPVLCAPDQHEFSLQIDNPYFPLPVDQQWVLVGKEQGEQIGLQITVTGATETLYKGQDRLSTLVVEELEWADADGDGIVDPDEEPIELSENYFAQTEEGTVCYFGEAVDIYEDGEVVSHEGAWRADENDNAPGIFMPADPQVGMTFQQEIAPGVAEDQATIVRTGSATVAAGFFPDTIRVRDFNPWDGSKGTKLYARGVGIIVDGPLELISFGPVSATSTTTSAAPETAASDSTEVQANAPGKARTSASPKRSVGIRAW